MNTSTLKFIIVRWQSKQNEEEVAALLMKIGQGVVAVILGFVTFSGVVMIGALVGHHVFPPPVGFDHHDPAAVEALPIRPLAAVLIAWGLGTFAGTWVAAQVAPAAKLAFGVGFGVVGLVAAIAIMTVMAHPMWMWVVGVVEFLPLAYLGAWLATRQSTRQTVAL
jgi:hypothetical protein